MAGIAACGAWLRAFLWTDRVWLIAVLLVVAGIALVLAQRVHAVGAYRDAFARHRRVAVVLAALAVLGVAAALHDQPYPLLMLCT
ncbi:MAG TPA: hypothetical protein VG840_07500, partial [Casimicrobiaceae bacterium]|nr:hypothetical protein [Casimicrobiaceae bacterium]